VPKKLALSIGIAVDHRRRSKSLWIRVQTNVARLDQGVQGEAPDLPPQGQESPRPAKLHPAELASATQLRVRAAPCREGEGCA